MGVLSFIHRTAGVNKYSHHSVLKGDATFFFNGNGQKKNITKTLDEILELTRYSEGPRQYVFIGLKFKHLGERKPAKGDIAIEKGHYVPMKELQDIERQLITGAKNRARMVRESTKKYISRDPA